LRIIAGNFCQTGFLYLFLLGLLVAGQALALPADTEIEARQEALINIADTKQREQLAALYASILEYSGLSKEYAERRETIDRRISEAPAVLENLKRQIRQLERNPPVLDTTPYRPTAEDGADVILQRIARIEERLAQEDSDNSQLVSRLAGLKQQLDQAQNRRASLQADSLMANQRIAEIENLLSAANENPDVSALANAQKWLLEAELAALRAQVNLLQQEWVYVQPDINIMQARMQIMQLQANYAAETVAELEDILSSTRVEMANQASRETQEDLVESKDKHHLVANLAADNATLSEEVSELSLQLRDSQQRAGVLDNQVAQLKERLLFIRQKIEIAGLSQAIGQLLLKEKRAIPLAGLSQKDTRLLQEQIATVGLRLLEHQRERRQLSDLQQYAEIYSTDLDEDTLREIVPLLLDLAESRRELLDEAIETEKALLRYLTEEEWAAIELNNILAEFSSFLSERLLWVRSSSPVNKQLIISSLELLESGQLADALGEIDIGLSVKFEFWTGLGLLICFVLLIKRRQIKSLLGQQQIPLKRLTTDSILYSLQAAFLAVLLAVPVPLLLALHADILRGSGAQPTLGSILGETLFTVAGYALVFQVIRKMCMPGGIVSEHFKWSAAAVNEIKKDLGRLVYLFLPVALIAGVLIQLEFETDLGAFPHISLTIMLLVLSYCFHKLFSNPKGLRVIYQKSASRHPPKLVQKSLQVMMTVAPVIIAFLGLMGYIITAGTLALHLLDTFIFLILVLLLQLFILRWLTLSQRRLAYQAAQEKLAAKLKQATTDTENNANTEKFEVEEYAIDIDQLSKGAQQVFSTLLLIFTVTGLWWIWSEVIPAFTLLQDISVWSYSETVEDKEKIIPVTVFDLGLAALILILTILAAKRVPALLEFLLLQRIKMSAGSHYTVRTLSGYIIVAVGLLSILSSLGASWSQLQWLAAALSVGIGFGLQEIVANFISGLIILFERPIRVGDVVTVGDTDGVVTRIQIRATTIRNWDQKELLVPNKEFITGRLLNWTLSDQTVRILIPVGIAYGSDVDKAMTIIENILETHPRVLEDPACMVSFESFGDNALILYIRAYVDRIEYRLPVTTDLHKDIYRELTAVGIGIAYPQRDIHLDTNKPLEVNISSGLHPTAQPAKDG